MNHTGTISNSRGFGDTKKVKVLSARGMTAIALLSAIASILMLFEFPLWFAPANAYKLDFSEVAVLIGAFALGPVAGVLIELIKVLLNFILNGTVTAGVGEFANFLIGCALVVPSSIIYYKRKTKKSAAFSLVIGTLVLVAVGCILNAYVLLPIYAKAFNMPLDAIIAGGTAINKNVTGLSGYVLLIVAPFNLLKGVLVSGITLFLYKYVSPVIKGYH